MSESLVIATSRYHNAAAIAESGLLPLGITLGAARWLSYELAGSVGMLAPYGLRDLDGEAFELAYRERLERFGATAIALVLEAFAAAHGSEGVVLLCFEDLMKPGESCHRRSFAAWWEEKTEQKVEEL